MGITPGDSGVVIGYQVDELTYTWSTKCLLLIHTFTLGLQAMCHPLTIFHFNQGVRIIHFWTKQCQDFEQGFNSILTDSTGTLEVDTSFDEHDVITSSISLGFMHSVETVSDTSQLQLAPSLRSHKLWCQTRALLSPMSLATKISASKLIHYFSIWPAAFGWPVFQHHQITSHWILPIGRLIRVSQNFRLALVGLSMPLSIQSNLFLASGCTCWYNDWHSRQNHVKLGW